MTLESTAYVFLVGGAVATPFSLPFGRILFALSLILMVIYLIRERKRPVIPAVAWLALLFFLAAFWASLFGVTPSKSLGNLDKLVWYFVHGWRYYLGVIFWDYYI